MKKIVFVLGLFMGSMLASDALAAVSFNTGKSTEISNDKPKKEKKRKHKKCCKKKDATASKSKGCSKEGASCCKKKAAETPAPTPAK